MKPVAIIQHIANDDPGFFATWLKAQSLPFEVFATFRGEALPATIAGYSGLCILGGPMSANDPLPYFPQLFALVREAVEKGIPVIGHCLGGQIMSRALGGTVQAAANTEIGWSALEATHPLATEWFGTAQPLRLFQWHGESFSIPPDATQLLRGIYCANQAFVLHNKHLGMQFHCEVDEPKVLDWLHTGKDELQTCASPGVQQAQDILPSLTHDLQHSQAIASHIYLRWATGLQH